MTFLYWYLFYIKIFRYYKNVINKWYVNLIGYYNYLNPSIDSLKKICKKTSYLLLQYNRTGGVIE